MNAGKVHVLYRLLDGEGRLLYIGRTHLGNLAARINYARGHVWGPEIAHARLEFLSNLGTLQTAELRAIKLEQPQYNLTGKVPVGTNRPGNTYRRDQMRRDREYTERTGLPIDF